MDDKYYELKLPSLLKPYKGVEKVEIRMLKGKDEKLLGELTIENFEKKFKILLDNVLRGIKPEDLTIGDRFYIVVWLAINCYSSMYPIETVCTDCFRTIKVDIDLGKLDKVELPADFKEPYPLQLTDGRTLNLRLFRVRDQIQYLDYVKLKDKDDLNYKLSQSIVDDQDMLARIQMLDEMSTKDLGLIRAFHDKFHHGVKLETEYKCPKCGGAGTTPVPFRLDIIFPDGATIARSLGRSV